MGERFWKSITGVLAVIAVLAVVRPADAAERLCDAAFEDCRQPLLDLIGNETVGIDVAFWFMQDARYKTEIITRWQAGVPVRVLVDPRRIRATRATTRCSPISPPPASRCARAEHAPGILHWKMMLFAGQNAWSSAAPTTARRRSSRQTPYVDYEDEMLYFTDDPSVVNSFMTKYDNLWIETTNYHELRQHHQPAGAQVYPIYTKDPALNFPQAENYALRILKRYPKRARRST